MPNPAPGDPRSPLQRLDPGADLSADADDPPSDDSLPAPLAPIRDPAVALERLKAGNERYVSGQPLRFKLNAARRLELTEGQTPLATVFACVDSRVPVERVFDHGHGELLVIRTAAHVLDDAAMGSIEFGVAQLATPLVVVLGHERCGAVAAAIEYAGNGTPAPGKIQTILERVGPAVEASRPQEGDALGNAVRTHSRMIAQLVGESEVIGPAVSEGRARIVAAYYSMVTGRVEFL